MKYEKKSYYQLLQTIQNQRKEKKRQKKKKIIQIKYENIHIKSEKRNKRQHSEWQTYIKKDEIMEEISSSHAAANDRKVHV